MREEQQPEDREQLRVACAWRGKAIKEGGTTSNGPPGGICPPCARKHFGLSVGL